MIIEGVDVLLGARLQAIDIYDDEADGYGEPVSEIVFDGKGWVAMDDDPDVSNEDREDVPLTDPMAAYWLARRYWRSSTVEPRLLGPDGMVVEIGGWDAPRQ